MNNPSIVHSLVDKKASFKYNENENTDESILEYIKANCEYPDQNECKGIVYVRFEVDKYGSVIDFTKLKDHGECNEFFKEVLSALMLMPKWQPADINGKEVQSYYSIQILFKII